MTLTFVGGPGAIFNALGKCAAIIKNSTANQLTQKTSLVDGTTGLIAQLVSEPDIQAQVGNNWISSLSGIESPISIATSVASSYIDRKVFEDNPQPGQTISTSNIQASLIELIRQMKSQQQTVLAMTVTAIPKTVNGQAGPNFTGAGDAVLVASVNRPSDGVVCENSFGESLIITCSADSYTGGQTAFNEAFSVTGEGAIGDAFAWNWPAGSGCSLTLNAIDGDTDTGSGNILTNSSFNNWAAGIPSNWVVNTGSSIISQENGIVFASPGSALKITGDGATNLNMVQAFNNSTTGTSSSLSQISQYSFCIFLRRDGIAAGTGTLEISLIDQNNNVITDQNGASNLFTIDLTHLTTTYTAYTGVFRTPIILPTSQSLRIRTTAALTNGRAVYLDKSSLGFMTQLYISGPSVSVHAGEIPSQFQDIAYITVTNSRGAGGTLSTWQTVFNQLLNTMQSDILLPSSATPTIGDNLIV